MSARDIKMGSSPFNESEEIDMNTITRLIEPVMVAAIAMVLVAAALVRLRRIDKGRVKWI